jgi:predicted house-cleaning noncanonical NTP pyrophosphatase (MazG superfamily)
MSSKLVRDKIPELIIRSGRIPKTHIADEEEFHQRLNDKLLEECEEFLQSGKPEELADILEVVEALRERLRISNDELMKIKNDKVMARGAFTQKIILDG